MGPFYFLLKFPLRFLASAINNSQILDKKNTGPDGLFWLRLFPTPKSWSLFLFLKGVARPCRAHRVSASQLGELVLIEDRH